MYYCQKCGSPLKDSSTFCTQCGAPVIRENINEQYPFQNASSNPDYVPQDYSEKKEKSGSSFIQAAVKVAGIAADAVKTGVEQRKASNVQSKKTVLAEGETGIRSYNVTKGRVPGKLVVTNKRLIFMANAKKSRVFMSTPIDNVGTISILTGTNIFNIIIGILLCLTVIGIIPAIFLFIRSKSMLLSVSAVNSSPGMVIGRLTTTGKAFKAVYGAPGPDAGKMMSEISALVLDVQQLGDKAVEKWRHQS